MDENLTKFASGGTDREVSHPRHRSDTPYPPRTPHPPSERTGAGCRLYSDDDVARLYRILALRRGSLPPEDIRDVLLHEGDDPRPAIHRHLERLDEQLRSSASGLSSSFERHVAAGTEPTNPEVQALARRGRELVAMFIGGDPGIAASLEHMWRKEGPERASRRMVSRDVAEYMQRALAVHLARERYARGDQRTGVIAPLPSRS